MGRHGLGQRIEIPAVASQAMDADQHPRIIAGALRAGGRWRTCLRRDEDGKELWQGGIYREVVEPERLVFTFAWDQDDGSPGHETLVTVTFAEQGERTRMTFRQAVFATEESCAGHRGGWNSAFDRLAEALTGH